MPPLAAAVRAAVETAQRTRLEPERARSRSLVLRFPTRRVELTTPNGKLTAAGRLYYRGREPPEAFDPRQEPIQVGRTEYIQMHNGKRMVARRFNDGRWAFTKVGKDFYELNRQTFILDVPGIRVVQGKNGETLRSNVHVPSTAFGTALTVPSVLEGAAKNAYLRQAQEKIIAGLEQDPVEGAVLVRDSHVIFYNPAGEWRFNEQVVSLDGAPRVETILERRLFGAPMLSSSVFAPWGLHPLGLEDHHGECVATQLATLATRKGVPIMGIDEVRASLDGIYVALYAGNEDSVYEGAETWRGRGVNARMIQAFAAKHDFAVYVLWNGSLVHRFTPVKRAHRAALAFAQDQFGPLSRYRLGIFGQRFQQGLGGHFGFALGGLGDANPVVEIAGLISREDGDLRSKRMGPPRGELKCLAALRAFIGNHEKFAGLI